MTSPLRYGNYSLVNPTTGQFTKFPIVLTDPPPGLTNKPAWLMAVMSSPSVMSFRRSFLIASLSTHQLNIPHWRITGTDLFEIRKDIE